MKILAIKLREIGDTVIFTSSLEALRKKYPTAQIDVLTLLSNSSVLARNEKIDNLFVVKKRSGIGLLIKLIRLRLRKYDLALGFHASSSICKLIRIMGAGEYIVHHHSRKETPRVSDRKLENPGLLQNALLRDYEILKALGIDHEPMPTKLYLSVEEKNWAENKVKQLGISLDKEIIAFLPGARGETRRYALEDWKKIFKKIKEKQGQGIVLVDKDLSLNWGLQEVCSEYDLPIIDNVSLREFMSLISVCNKSVCMDSSPLHFSVALGLTTYSLFGPGCIGDWHPYNKKEHKLFRLDVDCRNEGPRDQPEFQYCTISSCEHMSCMKHEPIKIVRELVGK